jgi:hypothetical protein
MPALLARFENHTIKIWEKHGIQQVGFWSVTSSPFNPIPLSAIPHHHASRHLLILTLRNTLVGPDTNILTYMLKWESLADREQKWNAFFADPEWIEARANSEKDGPINAKVSNTFLTPTKFSALQ